MSYIIEMVSRYGTRVKETTVEVPIGATPRAYIGDNALLRNKTIIGMYFWDGQDLSPFTGRDLADKNLQENTNIVFKSNNIEIFFGSPLASFGLSDTDKSYKPFIMEAFSPDQSYLTWDNSLTPEDDTSFLLTFIYLD